MFNENILKGKWDELKGSIQKAWGKLTDDDVESARGDFNKLSGIVQSKYGETQESIKEKFSSFHSELKSEEKSSYRPGEPLI